MGPSAALNRNPTPVTSVNDTSQAVPQPILSQQSTIPQPSCLPSMSEHLQEQRLLCGSSTSKHINKDFLQIKVDRSM